MTAGLLIRLGVKFIKSSKMLNTKHGVGTQTTRDELRLLTINT